MKKRTLAIARGELKPGRDEPKIWFTSTESMARILSEKNRALLAEIADHPPESLTELSERTGRAKSNLSRTLRTMERYGLVTLREGQGRQVRPSVTYEEISVSMSLARTHRRGTAVKLS
jgi:predicted transcriptional regulator